jgi:hypothetical protein
MTASLPIIMPVLEIPSAAQSAEVWIAILIVSPVIFHERLNTPVVVERWRRRGSRCGL